MIQIAAVPCLSDNYAWLLRCEETGQTAVVDPSEAAPVQAALQARGWGLDLILNTHHHYDHIGGNEALRAATGARVIAARADTHRIPHVDQPVAEGDQISVGANPATVLEIPGHTVGHVALHFERAGAIFVGDTMFSVGCGRLFEGTADQMWRSLERLRSLPGATRMYCGHEYTAANIRFARSIDPDNVHLQAREAEVRALRAAGAATVPSTLELERATNPFLRADAPELAQRMGLPGAPPARVFGALRAAKDRA